MDQLKKKEPKTSLRKGDVLEVSVSTLDSDGYSIGVVNNRQIRVRGALPGERVLARVEYPGKYKITANATKILHPSAQRRSEICCRISDCDGCSLLAMGYKTQLEWKGSLVSDHVRHYSSLNQAIILPVIPSPKELHYRNSAKLVIGGSFASPVIGIYKRDSHDLLDISNCPLHNPLINRIISAVKAGITKGKVPVFHQRSAQGLLRYLVVRVAESENRAMVVFVTAKRSYNELHHLSAWLRNQVPEVTVVSQNINPYSGNAILGNTDIFVTKESSLETSIDGIKFQISPRSFFQINSGSAGIIYNLVRKFSCLTGKENVLDLYCGTGAISLFLSGLSGNVHGIEIVESAVHDAILNAKLNRAGNCRFEAGDTVENLKSFLENSERLDLVVLNPPRKGCDEKVLHQVALLKPSRIIYVSCSPATLSRDLSLFHNSGYATEFIQPVDMFPHTPHIESVAVLNRHHPTG